VANPSTQERVGANGGWDDINLAISFLMSFNGAHEQEAKSIARLYSHYRRAVWFLQDIAAMSRKVGSETAAHALAQIGEPRERDGE
jgi:hypothetical protein